MPSLVTLVALAVLISSRCSALFMDMHTGFFQVEVLNDCSIYVFDRVIPNRINKNPEWCQKNKASVHPTVFSDGTIALPIVYEDRTGLVQIVNEAPNFKQPEYLPALIPQVVFQAKELAWYDRLISPKQWFTFADKYGGENRTTLRNVPHYNVPAGRYQVVQSSNSVDGQKLNEIIFVACKFGFPPTNYSRRIIWSNDMEKLDLLDNKYICDPNVMFDHDRNGYRIKVSVYEKNPRLRHATINGKKFLLHPISKSIWTGMLMTEMFKNFLKSVTQKDLYYEETVYRANLGMLKIKDGKYFHDGSPVERPAIEKDFKEHPFFFYNSKTKTYAPLFLYFKYTGFNRLFTVRFFNDGKYYNIFNLKPYSGQCGFSEGEETVAAAPRVIWQKPFAISIEVYFLINNRDFNFCVFQVDYSTREKETLKVVKQLSTEVNAYVHAEHRSTTAVNCAFEKRIYRFLYAYSTTKYKMAQLVSLNDDVSSPLFPCPNCNADTIMICDVLPETAVKYDAAVFLLSKFNDQTEIKHVVIVRTGNHMKLEISTKLESGHVYFVQETTLRVAGFASTTTVTPPPYVEEQEGPQGVGQAGSQGGNPGGGGGFRRPSGRGGGGGGGYSDYEEYPDEDLQDYYGGVLKNTFNFLILCLIMIFGLLIA